MKKKNAYPVPAANTTAHHGQLLKLSGKIANNVTPSSVPAAKLINAQSGLWVKRSKVLIDPPRIANT